MPKTNWIEGLACLSLANLSFIEVWNALLLYTPEQSFFLHRLPPASQYIAAAFAVILLGALFFGLLKLARWVRHRWGRFWAAPILFPMVLLPANVARNIISDRYPAFRVRLIGALGLHGIMLIFSVALAGLVLLLALIRGRQARIILTIVAQFSPLFALEIGESIERIVTARPANYRDRHLAELQRRPPARTRIVWIIFDELDYRLLFVDRPASVHTPEFERLRAGALNATQAFPPARDTMFSVPSLLTGKQFNVTMGSGADVLYAGEIPSAMQPMDVSSTIFADIHRAGGNVAVAGWYLPYCRMFQADLSACSWYDNGNILNITGDTLGANLVNESRSLLETSLFSPFGQSLTLKHAIGMVRDIRRDALPLVADPAYDLVYLHYPVPHAPHPYDRFQGTFTRGNSGFEGYLDSLALADLMLGEVRKRMTLDGAWDEAAVLVTSDHPYRESAHVDGKSDPRVPFLLKLPHQTETVTYEGPIRTLATRRLLKAIFRGEVSTPSDAIKWLCKQ